MGYATPGGSFFDIHSPSWSTWESGEGEAGIYPVVIAPFGGSVQGEAIVSIDSYSYATNHVRRFATTNGTWSATDQANWQSVAGTNWVTQSVLEPWWFYERANWVSAEEYGVDWVSHTTPAITPNPHPQYPLFSSVSNIVENATTNKLTQAQADALYPAITGGATTNQTLIGAVLVNGVQWFGTNAVTLGTVSGWCSGYGVWTNGTDRGKWESYDGGTNQWWELFK